jgi:pyruvate dehydrogenase E2 component (dihydrolipoamide acetyltransferase)
MPYEVKLPDIGEGVAEGEIVRWLVKAGDRVTEDQPLVEVMTDKASVEIPSPRTGTIAALLIEEGQVVPVGTVLVSIAVEGEAAPPAATPGAAATPAATPAATTNGDDDASRWSNEGGAVAASVKLPAGASGATGAAARVQAAPAVRQLAKSLGVALEAIKGSGPGGAITADDVTRAAKGGTAAATQGAPVAKPATAAAKPAATKPASGAATTPAPAVEGEERVPLRGLRRVIAEHMKRSIQTAAHYTFVAECDFTVLAAHRARVRARAEAAGIKLTYLAYILRALPETLREYPALNASLDDARGEIVLKHAIHLGVATHTREGLTVPVIRNADRLTLFTLAREVERLAAAARAGKLALDELQGGTFTVTSTGAKGGVLATPILHHPEVAILGVHEIRKRPAVVGDAIVARDLGNLSLSLDHRVVDGQVGADFLYALIARLEQPDSWLQEDDLA